MRRTIAFVVATSVLGASMSPPAHASWRQPADLPGMSDQEFTTAVAIAGIGTGLGLLISLTAPHPATLTDGDGLPVASAAAAQAAIGRLGGDDAPVKVTLRDGQGSVFGYLRAGAGGSLEVLTERGARPVAAADIQRIENLDQANQRGGRKRLGLALAFGGVSAAAFYAASTESSSLEGDSDALSTGMGVAFAAIAITTLVLPDGDARVLKSLRAAGPPDDSTSVTLGVGCVPGAAVPCLVASARF